MLWSNFGDRDGAGELPFPCLEWEWGYRGLGRAGARLTAS